MWKVAVKHKSGSMHECFGLTIFDALKSIGIVEDYIWIFAKYRRDF